MKNLAPVLLISLLAACSSQAIKAPEPVAEAAPINQPAPQVEPTVLAEPVPNPEPQAEVVVDPLNDPNGILAKRNVFFDFDKFDIKPEYQELIEAHGKYLASHPDTSVVLEGNADERGSREYNLALGQKRAVSVKKALSILGVGDKQLETISYGEEKPMLEGHDENTWSHNRRTDIKYK
jgi:peptidoglycan-associated lipoprotein